MNATANFTPLKKTYIGEDDARRRVYVFSHSGHIIATGKGDTLKVPVFDVRDGYAMRVACARFLKAANRGRGSAFFLDGNRNKVRRVHKEMI